MAYFTQGGYKRSVPKGVPSVAGTIFTASAVPFDMLMKRDLAKMPYTGRRLLDPQIYLSELDPALCSERCTRLATYGYFDVGELEQERTTNHKAILAWIRKSKNVIDEFWTRALPTGDSIDLAVRAALTVQAAIGCEALVLPSPITIELNSDLSSELDWLTRGLTIARAEFADLPVLATVAISDRALRAIDPYENRLVSSILDNVSSRQPDGVYIMLELAGEDGYYCASSQVVGALMRFADGFKRAELDPVVVSYATSAGLLTYAVGADIWCSGWYKSERRFQLGDCGDKAPGISAFPAYYSHPLAGEVHLANDLMRLMDAGLLEEITDITPFSQPLINALRKGVGVASVAPWHPRKNNIGAAMGHFATVMARETARLAPLTIAKRLDAVEAWLRTARLLAAKVGAIENLNPRTEILHQREWLNAVHQFRTKRQI